MKASRVKSVVFVALVVAFLVLAGCTPNQNPQPIRVSGSTAATVAPPVSPGSAAGQATAAAIAAAKLEFNVANCALKDANGLDINYEVSIKSGQCVWSAVIAATPIPAPKCVQPPMPTAVVGGVTVWDEPSCSWRTYGPLVAATPMPSEAAIITGTTRLTLGPEALAVLAEVDQTTQVQQRGTGSADFRFSTDPGQVASGALFFGVAGQLQDVRIVCDDTCSSFYLVTAAGVVKKLTPSKTYPPNFAYTSTLSVAEKEIATKLGVNVKDSEILAQNLFVGPVTVIGAGDQLVIYGADDSKLGVNRGIFTSWVLK